MSKQYYLMIEGKRVEVTEEVYRAYKQPLWREERNKRNRYKCRDGQGVRCNKRCVECDYARFKSGPQGNDLSLDGLIDDQMTDDGLVYDGFEKFIAMLEASQIRKEIMKMDEIDRQILAILGEGYSQADAARQIGISAVAVHKRVRKIKEKLKKFWE